MYEDADVDSTFHIPVSRALQAAIDEAERKKQQAVAPAVTTAPANVAPAASVSVAQTTPVQTVPVSSFVPVQYASKATYDDRMLYKELSAVSDEVLACRNKILNNIY